MSPKKLTFVLSGSIVAVCVLGLAAFWFSHQTLTQKSSQLSQTTADIALVSQQLDSYRNLEREYEDIAPLQEKVYAVLPTDKQQAEVTLQLNSIVNSVGLDLNGLTFETTSGRPGEQSQTLAGDISGVLVMPIQFQITSSYDDFLELLQKIENHQRYMQVSNLSISRSGEELQFNVSLEVFLKP